MQTNILWTGREYHSLENCMVTSTEAGNDITSTMIGWYEGKLYKIDYLIMTNGNWETLSVEIRSRHSNSEHHISLKGDGKGNWVLNDHPAPQFNGCIDVDLPLTPFTNTLPINRLKPAPGQQREVSVIYLDLLANEIKPVRQKYTCVSSSVYQYENIPNDFEARIEVDEAGLVVDYPKLFLRTAAVAAHYS